MNAITTQENRQPVAATGANLLDVISAAASNPDVDIDKVERLIAMHERMQAQQAKAEFVAAKVAMAPLIPAINMRGRIVIKDKNTGAVTQETPFARFEDIHEAVMPILTEHGFDLSFKNGLSPDGKVRVTTVLSHVGGHSEETYFDLPHDSSGSKNAVQAVGSSTSYAKRYGVLSILNIRVAGEDDDGAGSCPPDELPDEQYVKIAELVRATKANIPKLFEAVGAKADNLRTLKPDEYEKCVAALERKLAKMVRDETNAKAAANG